MPPLPARHHLHERVEVDAGRAADDERLGQR